jgi:hypothetical protein
MKCEEVGIYEGCAEVKQGVKRVDGTGYGS